MGAAEQTDLYADYKKDDCDTLNFDALLLSGYLCHVCLPNPCDNGGKCMNVPNLGYRCDCSKIAFSGDQCQNPDKTLAPTTPFGSAFNSHRGATACHIGAFGTSTDRASY